MDPPAPWNLPPLLPRDESRLRRAAKGLALWVVLGAALALVAYGVVQLLEYAESLLRIKD